MTYEEYLDEVTTLIFEKYDVPENDAVRIVMAAQDKEFFVPHDKNAKLRNVDQAHKDAKSLFEAAGVKAPAKRAVKSAATSPAKSAASSPAKSPARNAASSAANDAAKSPARSAAKGPAKPAK